MGYLVATKRVTTSNKKVMYFGNFLDTNNDFVDTTHFPPAAARYPFRGKGCYLITGKVASEFGHVSLEVTAMEPLKLKTLDNCTPADFVTRESRSNVRSLGASDGWQQVG